MKKTKILKIALLGLGVYGIINALKKGKTNIPKNERDIKRAVLIVINGESNAGGMAKNKDATPYELEVNNQVYIFNADVFDFQPMQIGHNNNTGHFGLDSYMHGVELGISNKVREGVFGDKLVFIVKTGQGGSKIEEWNERSEYTRIMKERINYSVKYLTDRGFDFESFVIYTQGINDAVKEGGDTVENWKEKTIRHIGSIRGILGDIKVFFIKHMIHPELVPYIQAIDDLSSIDRNIIPISSEGATLEDKYHFDYFGMKLISYRIIEKMLTYLKK